MSPPLRTGFQTFANNELPKAVPGDFAGANIRASLLAGAGAFVAGQSGVNVGVFAWFDPVTGQANNYFKIGAMLAFIHRNNQGLITLFLGISTTKVVPGNMVAGMDQGDFWGLFSGGATAGQSVYADPVTGALTAAASGATTSGLNTTGASTSGGVLTTTDADQTGLALAKGQLVTGGTLPEGTYIAAAAGTGSGTHLWTLANVNGTAVPDNAGPFTATNYGPQATKWKVVENVDAGASFTGALASTGILTTSVSVTGTIQIGQFLAGAGIPDNSEAQILTQLTGTPGGIGTYQTSYAPTTPIGAEAMTSVGGQMGKITSWL